LRLSIRIFPENEKDICKVEIWKRSTWQNTNELSWTFLRLSTDKSFCEQSRITRLCQECRVGSFAVATYIPEYGITPRGKISLDLQEFRIPQGFPTPGILVKVHLTKHRTRSLSRAKQVWLNKNILLQNHAIKIVVILN